MIGSAEVLRYQPSNPLVQVLQIRQHQCIGFHQDLPPKQHRGQKKKNVILSRVFGDFVQWHHHDVRCCLKSCSASKHAALHTVPALESHIFQLQVFKRICIKKGVKGGQVNSVFLAPRAQVDLASGLEVISDLGLDTLTFLAATVLVVPAFKAVKVSPILGFFLSGVVLNHLGLFRNITDVKALSELGILFLLFEMGLELSLARLKALAKYAFGLGLAQVVFSTLAFTAFELPPDGAIGTKILMFLFHSRPDLVNIRSVDEAVVIGAALAMSSSAFVLQLLAEKGELPTRFGSATLGILLFQDIAVVPLLVILPILESGSLSKESLWPLLATESLKALAGLGALSFSGQFLLRRIFEVVADSRSAEAFIALCILTVTGTSLLTQKLGFSDTLGAFLAGALLAETNFRTQIEADIRPFRGLLLGLFFVTTGASIDIQLLIREWPNVLTLLGGLIFIKTAIITVIGPRVGLSLPESVRIGLLLSQGGEFAFVVFSLANRLGVLPLELNRLLIIVVVLSMSLTPFLNELGGNVAEFIETQFNITSEDDFKDIGNFQVNDPVVIIGFGQMGQVLANFLSTPLTAALGGDIAGWPFVAFDLDPGIVKTARKLGFPVLYGDGSRPEVLETAGITMPKAVMVMYTVRQKSLEAVERLHLAFPGVPIYARALDLGHLLELKSKGATDAVLESAETSLQLGSVLLRGLGVMSDDVNFLTRVMRESMELRAREAFEKNEGKEDWSATLQVKIQQSLKKQPVKGVLLKPSGGEKIPPENREANGTLLKESLDDEDGRTTDDLVLSAMPKEVIKENVLQFSSTGQTEDKKSSTPQKISEKVQMLSSARPFESLNEGNGASLALTERTESIHLLEDVNKEENGTSVNGSLKTNDDGRGVTWCALNPEENNYEEELEEEEKVDGIDENMQFVSKIDRP